jgi:hypothetical protein
MDIQNSFNGSIMISKLNGCTADLVFTMRVLIHIYLDHQIENMQKIFDHSKKIYFNRRIFQ